MLSVFLSRLKFNEFWLNNVKNDNYVKEVVEDLTIDSEDLNEKESIEDKLLWFKIPETCRFGEVGPGGGIMFDYQDGYYYEARKIEGKYEWGCEGEWTNCNELPEEKREFSKFVIGLYSEKNTYGHLKFIPEYNRCLLQKECVVAPKICSELNVEGVDGWRLPNHSEWVYLTKKRKYFSDFDGAFWLNGEFNSKFATSSFFCRPIPLVDYKSNKKNVSCIRLFEVKKKHAWEFKPCSNCNECRIGDVGPAGGVIFYKKNDICYETTLKSLKDKETFVFYRDDYTNSEKALNKECYIDPLILGEEEKTTKCLNELNKLYETKIYLNNETYSEKYRLKADQLAPAICLNYERAGKFDWFLPSGFLLKEMQILHNKFLFESYDNAGIYFDDNNINHSMKKVRCIRKFTNDKVDSDLKKIILDELIPKKE